jgi:ribonuclease P protein component
MRSADFRDAGRGARAGTPLLSGRLTAAGGVGAGRVGFIVSRKVGPAVTRNRVRRRLRHLARGHLARLPPGSLLVLRAAPAAATATYAGLAAELDRVITVLLRRAAAPRSPGPGYNG